MLPREEIERRVRVLQREIFRSVELLLPTYSGDPLELLEPRLLAQVLGADFVEQPGLSLQPFPYRGRMMQTAGLIHRPSNQIAIDSNFSIPVRRFTGAHECGHWELHPHEMLHRDLPLNGSPLNHVRSPMEREADRFAVFFLMPSKQVREEFRKRFGTEKLAFNNTVAQLICPERADELLYSNPETKVREKALASCRTLSGRPLPSLAQRFRVSVETMAIRLEELSLIEWP